MQRERPHLMILTGDLNCRSSQWWPQDMEEPQGMALEELIETNNLHQLIDEPTNIRGETKSLLAVRSAFIFGSKLPASNHLW